MAIQLENGKTYEQVAERVLRFRDKHTIEEGWGIVTDIVEATDYVVRMQTKILSPSGVVVATGAAEERRNANEINITSALENCETSAIGRALFSAGYGNGQFCTAEDLANILNRGGKIYGGKATPVSDPTPPADKKTPEKESAPAPEKTPDKPSEKEKTPSPGKASEKPQPQPEAPKQDQGMQNESTGDKTIDDTLKTLGLMPGQMKEVAVSIQDGYLVLQGKGTFSLSSTLKKMRFIWNKPVASAWNFQL